MLILMADKGFIYKESLTKVPDADQTDQTDSLTD